MRAMRRAGLTAWLDAAIPVISGLGAVALAALSIAITAKPCLAGPPFFTDDPVTVDTGHWEINNFIASTVARGAVAGGLPGIDANYGAAENVQLHLMAALEAVQTTGVAPGYGPGDIELGIKYRFIPARETDWWPQVGIYPFLDLPTGSVALGTGTGATHAYLPIWIEKDFGKWTAYGGAGYWINPGTDNKNFWFSGGVVQYQLTDTLALGGELYYETASSTAAPGTAAIRSAPKTISASTSAAPTTSARLITSCFPSAQPRQFYDQSVLVLPRAPRDN